MTEAILKPSIRERINKAVHKTGFVALVVLNVLVLGPGLVLGLWSRHYETSVLAILLSAAFWLAAKALQRIWRAQHGHG